MGFRNLREVVRSTHPMKDLVGWKTTLEKVASYWYINMDLRYTLQGTIKTGEQENNRRPQTFVLGVDMSWFPGGELIN